jgi:chemotaxis protein CheY-P-specific phosphatase CheC
MSAFQTALSKTTKRRIQKATPEQQSLILSSIVKWFTLSIESKFLDAIYLMNTYK